MYNKNDLTTADDTSELMTPLINSQNTGEIAFIADPQDWEYGEDTSLYDIIIDIGKKLENDQKGAYFVLDTGEVSGMTKVLVFSSLNNAAAPGAFGNTILSELINQQVADKDKSTSRISLTITSWPLKQAVLVDTFLNSTAANITATFLSWVIVVIETTSLVLFMTRAQSGNWDAI
jgi:hypothetical protein